MRLGRVGETTESGLGCVKLGIGQPRGGGAIAGLGLQTLDFQSLTLGGSLGGEGEFLRMRLPSSQPVTRKTISPEGFVNSEMTNRAASAL